MYGGGDHDEGAVFVYRCLQVEGRRLFKLPTQIILCQNLKMQPVIMVLIKAGQCSVYLMTTEKF